MRFFVFISTTCHKDAQEKGFAKEIEKLRIKVEADQSVDSWEDFLPSPIIQKKLGGYRLVAEKRIVDDSTMAIVFLTILKKGTPKYEKFHGAEVEYCENLKPSNLQVTDEIRARIREENSVPIVPEPNDIEYSYLFDQGNSLDFDDGIVFESHEWVQRISKGEYQQYLTDFYNIASGIFGDATDTLKISSSTSAQILFRYFPESKILFLISPITKANQSEIQKIQEQFASILMNSTVSQDELLRQSGRSYPALVLADDFEVWSAIESNKEGNLALSPEESVILESVFLSKRPKEKRFPLFINGRPGSGKSTVLHYMFAEFFFRHIQKSKDQRLKRPPLYLTYNPRLLENARAAVVKIVTSNHKFAAEKKVFTEQELEETLDQAFEVFHDFLKKSLPSEKSNLFRKDKRIDFGEFKKRWSDHMRRDFRNELKKINAELAWHVIRTYIKGMRDDEDNYFDKDSYFDLPEKRKTVSQKTFDLIYDECWEGWYYPLCNKSQYWDDQDLTRKVLDEVGADYFQYPAVFCDEAQDFTRIELELIFRMNLFSRRRTLPDQIKNIAFSFAGDPFQTLNPTGFNWESVSSAFYERIVQHLDPSGSGRLQFNPQELKNSYRSTRHIVGVCNLILLVRGILFNIPKLHPQVSWFERDASVPEFYDIQSQHCVDRLREEESITVILPCQEDEELDYIEKDSILKELSVSGDRPRTFLSPMAAKGQEFPRVVIYKFGDDCVRNYPTLLDPLSSVKPQEQDLDRLLPMQYFMNRLYVAASRAQKRLIIVDTEDGISKFWNNAMMTNPDALIDKYRTMFDPNNPWGTKNICLCQPGVQTTKDRKWSEDRENPEELAEVAKNLKEDGRRTKSSYKLRLASANFERASLPDEAKRCMALCYEIENKYTEAAKLYQEQSLHTEALGCYWQGGLFSNVVKNVAFSEYPEYRASDFMLGVQSGSDSIQFLDFISNEMRGPRKNNIIDNPTWINVFEKLIAALAKMDNTTDGNDAYRKVMAISQEGLPTSQYLELGKLACKAGLYEEALKQFNKITPKPVDAPEYVFVKSQLSPFPESIEWLHKQKNGSEIITQWKTHSLLLEEKYETIVYNAIIEKQAFDLLPQFIEFHPKYDYFFKALSVYEKEQDDISYELMAHRLICHYVDENRWTEVLKFLNSNIKIKKLDLGIKNRFVFEFAKSSPKLNEENEKAIADFIEKWYIKHPESIFSIKIVGTSVEKSNRMILSLEFYENIWKHKKYGSEADLEFARRRWLRCKNRQIERGKSTSRGIEDFEKYSAEWGYSIDDIPQYEDLDGISFSDEYKVPVQQQKARASTRVEIRKDTISEEQRLAIKDLYEIGYSVEKIRHIFPTVSNNTIEMIIDSNMTEAQNKHK